MLLYRRLITGLLVFGLTFNAYAMGQSNKNTGDQQNTQTTESQQTTPAEKVNINTATMDDLMKVKGLSKAKAKSILTYRKKNGDFKSLDDLKLVTGFKRMKENKLKTIQDQLTI